MSRWETMTPAQQRKRVKAMQAGRRKARTPARLRQRLAEASAEVERLGSQVNALRAAGEPIPYKLRAELRDASTRELNLRWAD